MLKRVKFSRWSWLAATTLLMVAGVSLWLALPGSSQAAQVNRAIAVPTVLQGHVTYIQKNSITIRTPDIRPTVKPGQMTPMYIIAGESYRADIALATFETPTGQPALSDDLQVGDSVVVVCAPFNRTAEGNTPRPWLVTAYVVEKLQIPIAR